MKIIIFLFILTLNLSWSKKKKHYHKQIKRVDSTSWESSSEYNLTIEHQTSGQNHANLKKNTTSSRRGFFNFRGSLRRNFAIELSSQYVGSNVVCSPVSALLPLGKLILGAEGKTRTELTKAIGEYKKSSLTASFTELIKKLQYIPSVKLDIASRIYVSVEDELQPKFAASAKAIFKSEVEKINFRKSQEAVDEINGWISRQTNGMIPLLLDTSQISAITSMVVVNAVYFKGKWKDPFKTLYVGNFYAPTGQKKVQVMNIQNKYRYMKSAVLSAEIVEIPYEGSGANFIIVLPIEKAGLTLLLNQLKLAPTLLKTALEELTPIRLDLTIPKFSTITSFNLKEIYEKIGVKQMLSPSSGLKNIVKDRELKLSTAIQKAVIEVHETGTEASAASAIIHATGAFLNTSEMIQFTADHPFLFYVEAHREQLFAGIYSDP